MSREDLLFDPTDGEHRAPEVNVATVTRGDPWAEEKPKPSTPDRPSPRSAEGVQTSERSPA